MSDFFLTLFCEPQNNICWQNNNLTYLVFRNIGGQPEKGSIQLKNGGWHVVINNIVEVVLPFLYIMEE